MPPAAVDDDQDDADDSGRPDGGGHHRAGRRRCLRGRQRRVGHNDETVRDVRHQDHFADIAAGR